MEGRRRSLGQLFVPICLETLFYMLAGMVDTLMLSSVGDEAVGAVGTANTYIGIFIIMFSIISTGVMAVMTQNIGAGKWDRIKAGFSAGLKLVWALCVPLALLYFFCGRMLMGFFLENPTELAMHTGAVFLRILSPFYFVVSAKLVADGILRGSGRMKQFMTATFTDLILRVVLAFVLSATPLGATGIWCAWPIGWTVATVLSIRFYRRGQWNP